MLATVVLIAAPAAPLIRANAAAWSMTIVGNQADSRGAARNERDPIANPIVPKIANPIVLLILLTVDSHCRKPCRCLQGSKGTCR